MSEEMILPQEIEQVLFMGETSIDLLSFIEAIPTMGGDYYDIYAFKSKLKGFMVDNHEIKRIHKRRICPKTVYIGGKKTIVIMADITAVDKNRSFLDKMLHSKDIHIEDLMSKNAFLERQNMVYDEFIKEQNMEHNFKEKLQNMTELIRTTARSISPKSESPDVSVSVGGSDEKKK